MGLLSDEDTRRLGELFKQRLVNDVRLLTFTQETECQFCKETRSIVEEVASTSDRVKAEVYDFVKDEMKARELGVDKIPAIAVLGKRDYGVRFYGVPSGYEFMPLIEAIIDVSAGTTKLSSATKERLKTVNRPVHIQVFTTPNCPYCPRAVRLAHQFAVENENIRADMVESIEFPQLVYKYRVMGVPKVVINETAEFTGAYPEELFVTHLLQALGPPSMVV
ncbi:MAG: thioredoxin family protein [Candidatus Bathyarchaeia archaeon]